ncbi:MAG: hypothetical protein HQK99_12800 [Nitrospirae bacterium]|nr:hypothetical protein [Nitrospirota bacterium]
MIASLIKKILRLRKSLAFVILLSMAVIFLIISLTVYYYHDYHVIAVIEKEMKAVAANIIAFEKNWQKDKGVYLGIDPAGANEFLVKNNLAYPTTKLTGRVSTDGPNNIEIYVYPDYKKTGRWSYVPLVYVYRLDKSKEEQGFVVQNGRLAKQP